MPRAPGAVEASVQLVKGADDARQAMRTLLLSLVLTGIVRVPVADANRLPTAVIVVMEGSPGQQGEAASKIVGTLKTVLGCRHALQVVRFDAEPGLQSRLTVKGANRDLMAVEPRTPMREAIEAGLIRLITVSSPRTMVVIAHEQFYPTTVSKDRLLELARRSEAKIHAIYLASSRDKPGALRRFGRSLRNGIVWLVEVIILEERGYSARDTSRLLKFMADATGGKYCVATDESSGIVCADGISAAIAAEPQLYSQP